MGQKRGLLKSRKGYTVNVVQGGSRNRKEKPSQPRENKFRVGEKIAGRAVEGQKHLLKKRTIAW